VRLNRDVAIKTLPRLRQRLQPHGLVRTRGTGAGGAEPPQYRGHLAGWNRVRW
jgi:hypothetical protein